MEGMANSTTLNRQMPKKYVAKWRKWGILALSPLYLSLLSTCFGLIAILTPPQWISIAMRERDFMFFNPLMFIVIVFSEVAFISGLLFYAKSRRLTRIGVKKSPRILPSARLLDKAIWLLVGSIIIEIMIGVIIVAKAGLGNILLALNNPIEGSQFRNHLLTLMRIHGVNMLVFQDAAYLALIVAIFIVMCSTRKSNKRVAGLMLAALGSVCYITVSLLTLTRWQVLQFLFSLGAIYLLYRNAQNGVARAKLVSYSVVIVVLSCSIFILVNALKTNNSDIDAIVGYTIGSYNIAASVVSGIVTQPFSGSTYGTLGAIWNAPILGPHIRELGKLLGLDLPTGSGGAKNSWNAWRDALQSAGINPAYNWDTVFGYVYGDIGIAFPIAFFVYGYISEYLFNKFQDLRLFGVMLYLPFFVSIITWFTSVFISNTALDDDIIFSIIIWLFIRHDWYAAMVPSKPLRSL